VESPDSMRGYEWTVAKLFFLHYFKPLGRYKRMPRTRNDIPNLLLDIGYTMLYNILEAHLNLYGFDIYKWVYHTGFYERKSLVCDLVEPFRCLIDRQLRKSYNLWQIDEKDFYFKHGEYAIRNDQRVKYLKLLLNPVLAEKEIIFQYVKSFYACMMSGESWTILPFYIKA
jgi:CRISPR-associated protein Cas1